VLGGPRGKEGTHTIVTVPQRRRDTHQTASKPWLDPRMWDGEGPHVPTATAGRSSTAPGTRNRVDRSTLQLRWVPTPLLPSLSWVLHRSLRRVRCLTPDAARGCSCRANALVCRSRVVAAQEKF
jgi:hypothetical protein